MRGWERYLLEKLINSYELQMKERENESMWMEELGEVEGYSWVEE
jgi:hypothetical protein